MDANIGWHFSHTVSLTGIVATLLALFSAITFAFAIDTRVTVLENKAQTIREQLIDIKVALNRIEDKLDKKADR